MHSLLRDVEINTLRKFHEDIFSFRKAKFFSIAGLRSKFLTHLKGKRASEIRRLLFAKPLIISILVVLSGADDFGAIAEFAKSKKYFLQSHKLLETQRFASHDTFRHIFMNLGSKSYAMYLSSWLEASVESSDFTDDSTSKADAIALNKDAPKKMVHINRKSIRATQTSKHSRTALQIVSAFCSINSLLDNLL